MADIIEELGRQYTQYKARIHGRERGLQEYLKKNKEASQDVLSFLRELNSHDFIKGYAEILGQDNKKKGMQVHWHDVPEGIPGDRFVTYLTQKGEPCFWLINWDTTGGGYAQHNRINFNEEGVDICEDSLYTLYLSEYVGLTKDERGRFKRNVWSNLRHIAQESLENSLMDAVALDRLKIGRIPHDLMRQE